LLYGAVVVTLLTYSRFGLVLAVLAVAAWTVLEHDRVESLAAALLAAGVGGAVFAVALALPGITKDAQSHGVRAHDGWIFALAVLAGGALVAVLTVVAVRAEQRHPLGAERRRALERAAAVLAVAVVVAGVAASAVFAGRIWRDFANPVGSQISSSSGHALSLSSSNRWRWWVEEWHAFTTHPLLGTGAGTFQLTDLRYRQSSLVTTTEPHNTPLQFLGELGIVGFLLLLGAVGAAAVGVVRARRRAGEGERAAVTALGVGLAAFALHLVVDMDWNFLATCGPLLLLAGLVLGRPASPATVPSRRPLVAVAAVLIAFGGVYSLAAPWLAQRQLATAASSSAFSRAHGYDPLSTDVLSDWAAYEAATGNLGRALQLYRDETALEPENGSTWFDLGSFYFDNKAWAQAYDALSKAWQYDPQGPTGVPCGLLDQARHKALGTWPPSCPRGA
ncbi:MAG TPA: O-antigen ligase family protein, partial [Gaiellaceae bacterium]|nr:O-antigen ligase family protein [Gaiellaceae bacterium]